MARMLSRLVNPEVLTLVNAFVVKLEWFERICPLNILLTILSQEEEQHWAIMNSKGLIRIAPPDNITLTKSDRGRILLQITHAVDEPQVVFLYTLVVWCNEEAKIASPCVQ